MARDARPESLKDFVLVAVRSWFLRGGGDEDDLIDCMVADKFTAENTFVVGDWSGDWQPERTLVLAVHAGTQQSPSSFLAQRTAQIFSISRKQRVFWKRLSLTFQI
jgi:hypothetical protein